MHALLNRWDKLNDEQKKLMLTTAGAGRRPAQLADRRAADVARIDTGRLQLHRQAIDLELRVERVRDSIWPPRPRSRWRSTRTCRACRPTPTR